MKNNIVILRILAIFCFSVPFIFYWYKSDYGCYLEMISGPYPFSHMGSSIFQLYYIIILPYIIGGILLLCVYFLKKKTKK